VTANYTLSFDALREALDGIDGYILVLDTRGINVWCAAGKGTFGADELLNKIDSTSLQEIVSHRALILPQLGASGVSACEVRKKSGFKVEYGPVCARDLPKYMEKREAGPEMRRIRFDLVDRIILIPVELVQVLLPMLIIAFVIYFPGGVFASLAVVTSFLAGVVLFPILFPWIPTRDFSSRGFILGIIAAVPFACIVFFGRPASPLWLRLMSLFACIFTMSPITAFLALNFTGATPVASKSRVKREIYRYIPIMAWFFGIGAILAVVVAFIPGK